MIYANIKYHDGNRDTYRTPHWKIKAGSHYSDSPQLGFELAKKFLTQQCPIRMRSYDATTGNIVGTAAQLVTEDGFVPGAYVVRKKDKVTAVIQHFDKEMVILRVIGEGPLFFRQGEGALQFLLEKRMDKIHPKSK